MKRLLLCAVVLWAGVVRAEPVVDEAFTREVIRHLYRWYLDEADVDAQAGKAEMPVWTRAVERKLDAGDHSRFAEMVFPSLGVKVALKKTDYRVEELGLDVKSRSYRIINVVRERPADDARGYEVTRLKLPALREYLFETRNQREYPDAALAQRLRQAVRTQLGHQKGEHICHVGPLSPVSNELWVFWENARMLVRFSSDLDLSNPSVWRQENLTVRTFDIDRQVVLSFSEAPGSNAFLTRHQIGRVLYNCIVLGQRQTLTSDESK
jgi:hypothetical protein